MSSPVPEVDDADVVVIGGGPAGATAARLLSTWGHRVILLTRAPTRQHLAESLPPSGVRLLDRLGVRERIDTAGFVRATGNTVWWGTVADEPRVERFAEGTVGLQVERDQFDRILLELAESAGTRLTGGAMVRQVDRVSAGAYLVHYDTSEQSHRVAQSRWVLDCSGRAGLLARHGRRNAMSSVRTIALVGVWIDTQPETPPREDASHTVVESYDDGWGWSVPGCGARRYVTVMVDPARTMIGDRDRLAAVYHEELARLPRLGRLVGRATLAGQPWARDASPYYAERAAEDQTLLVGDAASFVDPLSSFGIKKAMASAWLAAVVARTCLTNEAMAAPARDLYESRERAMHDALVRRLADVARDAAGRHATPFWGERAELEAGASPEPDIATLRGDADVRAAFEHIRAAAAVRLTAAPSLKRVQRPTVRDDRVVLEEHLVASGFGTPLRYLRNIDLVRLVDLAPHHVNVPDLYDAYYRGSPDTRIPPLPDFLGALAVLVGKRFLELT